MQLRPTEWAPVEEIARHAMVTSAVATADYDPQIYAIIDGLFRDAAPLELCNG